MIINISDDIVYIDGTQYHRQSEDAQRANAIEEQLAEMRSVIDGMLSHAEVVYANYGLEKLSINMAEAEGYLRAAKEIKNTFDEIISIDVD